MDGHVVADELADHVDLLSMPSTSLVQSRVPTKSFSVRARRMPPSTRAAAALVLLRVDHPDAVGRDGEVVDVRRVPGMRRSCRTRNVSELSSLSRAPRRSSPTAPVSQAFVLWGSSPRARITPPSRGCLARTRSSRRSVAPFELTASRGTGRADLDSGKARTSVGLAGLPAEGGRDSEPSWWCARRRPRSAPPTRDHRHDRCRHSGASSASRQT